MKNAAIALAIAAILFFGCASKQPAPSSVPAPSPIPGQITGNDTAPIVEQNDTPAPDEIPIPPVEERRLGKEGEFCGGIAANIFQCEPGLACVLDGNYPDAGGTCQRQAAKDSAFHSCPQERNQACTKEHNPVCGRLVGATPDVAGYGDFGNPCVACSVSANAIGYYMGTCGSRGST